MSRFSYAWEKLHIAVHALAGWGDPYSRMEAAAISIHTLDEKQFPEELQEEWKQLWNDLTSVDAKGDEGRVRATIKTFDEISFGQMADRIISLYDSICRKRIILEQN